LWISRHGDVEVLQEGNELVGRDLAKKLEGRVGWRKGHVVAYLASPDKYAVSDRERENIFSWLARQVCGL